MSGRKYGWSRRSAATLGLLFHLVLVGAGPLVDARLEAAALAARHTTPHLDEHGAPSCAAAVHEHDFCLIRALHSLDVPPGDGAPRMAPDLAVRRLPSAPLLPSLARLGVWALGPRAPPAV